MKGVYSQFNDGLVTPFVLVAITVVDVDDVVALGVVGGVVEYASEVVLASLSKFQCSVFMELHILQCLSMHIQSALSLLRR